MAIRPRASLIASTTCLLLAAACGRSLEYQEGTGGSGVGTIAAVGPSSGQISPTGAGGEPTVGPGGDGGFGVISSAGPGQGPGPGGQGGFGQGPGQGPGPGGQGGFAEGPGQGPGPGPGSGPGPGPGGQGGFAEGPGQGPGPGGQGGFAQGPGQGPGGVGGGEPTCPGFGDECTQCISNQCGDRWCDCSGNSDCLAFFGCTGECSTDDCISACYAEHPDGLSDAFLVLDCAEESCPGACPGIGEVPDCTECLFQDCEAVTVACLSDPDCLDLYDCLSGCSPVDLECNATCYDTLPDGIPTLQDLLECSVEECATVCN